LDQILTKDPKFDQTARHLDLDITVTADSPVVDVELEVAEAEVTM